MKLFISNEILKNIGQKVKLVPLDLNRTRITISNVVQKEDGTKEITPFYFIVPISSLVLEQSKDSVLIDVYGLTVTHNDEKNTDAQNDNVIYAMLCQRKMSSNEIYVPVEQKEKMEVLYKIQNEDEWFYIIRLNLSKEDRVPIYFTYESDFLVQKFLLFKCSNESKLTVKDYNTYFVINRKNQILYRPLFSLGGKIAE